MKESAFVIANIQGYRKHTVPYHIDLELQLYCLRCDEGRLTTSPHNLRVCILSTTKLIMDDSFNFKLATFCMSV